MAWKILICRAKPNPAGKDRAGGYPRHEQLLGEWVDLRNTGDAAVVLSTIHLSNMQFSQNCIPNGQPNIYWNGSSNQTLAPGQILRVHTGKSTYSYLMSDEDKIGVDLHVYAEKGNFVLNNKCGDVLAVLWRYNNEWRKEDGSFYDPNPPEGAILKRVGDKLVP